MDEKLIRKIVRQVSEQLEKEIVDGALIEQMAKRYNQSPHSVKDPALYQFIFAKEFSEKLITEVLVKLLCDSQLKPEV